MAVTVGKKQSPSDPGTYAEAITPSDSTNFTNGLCNGIYVGGAGVVITVDRDDNTCSWTVPAGGYIKLQCKRVNSTTTTATLMVAIY